MQRRKIGIGTWAFIRGGHAACPVPLEVVLTHVRAQGFDGAELAGFSPHMHPQEYPTPAARGEVRRLLEDIGLDPVSLAADFAEVPPGLVAPTQYLEVVRANLDICHDLGIPTLRVDTISQPGEIADGQDRETCFWRIVEAWQRAAETCAREGVRVVWEFEAAFLFNKPSDVMRMLYAVDHPNFTALFDSFHAFNCGVLGARQMGEPETLPGGIPQFAHMLTGKILHVHFIDSDETLHDGDTSTHAPFGQGVLNFDEIVPALYAAGYKDEWWPMDLCFWPGALEATAPAKAFMDKLNAKYG